MPVTDVEQTAPACDRPPQMRRARLAFALVSLTVAILLATWGYSGRDALREKWLALQPTESLQRLDSRNDSDALVHFAYANRLVSSGAAADAWPPAARATAAIPISDRGELAGRIRALNGYLAAQFGETQQAADALNTAALARPHDPSVFVGQGILALRRSRIAEAIAALTHAAQLDPGRKETWSRIGSAYLLAAEPEQAAEAFRRAVKLAPADPQTHADLAEALGRLARFDEAGAECRTAANLAPDAVRYATLPAISRASSARGQADYDAAVQMLNDALAKFPNADRLHALLAGLHARFNQYEPARRELEKFLARTPKDSNGWLNLATVCERLGDNKGAATAGARYRWIADAEAESTRLKQLALLQPTDVTIRLRLAAALQRCGKIQEAVTALVRASELKPDDPEIMRTLALAQSFLKDTANAAEQSRNGEEIR